jgi:hypothetical protein
LDRTDGAVAVAERADMSEDKLMHFSDAEVKRLVDSGAYRTMSTADLERMLPVIGVQGFVNDASKHQLDFQRDSIRAELQARKETQITAEARAEARKTTRVARSAARFSFLSLVATVTFWAMDHWDSLAAWWHTIVLKIRP